MASEAKVAEQLNIKGESGHISRFVRHVVLDMDGDDVYVPVVAVSNIVPDGDYGPVQTTVTTGAEADLLAAIEDTRQDLLTLIVGDTAGAANTFTLKAKAGGDVVMTLVAPANSTAQVTFPVPFQQGEAGEAWRIASTGAGVATVQARRRV